MNKRRILIFADYFTPGYLAGGPIRSIQTIINCLHRSIDFTVVTRNHDFGITTPYPLAANQRVKIAHCDVYYLTKEKQTQSYYRHLINTIQPHIIYLNSFFSYRFSQLPLKANRENPHQSKIIIAPRGEFSPGALAIKPLKKKLFLHWTKRVSSYHDVTFHATSELEKQHIRAQFISQNIIIAPNLLSEQQSKNLPVIPKTTKQLNCIYLSRITAKKNLLGTLQVLQKATIPIQFDIYGPLEDDAYWQQCKICINMLPKNVTCRYLGVVKPSDVHHLFAKYDCFLFLTWGENFGHAIVEALQAGCPVITSKMTPWHPLDNKGGLWDFSLDDTLGILNQLTRLQQLSASEYDTLRIAAKHYVDTHPILQQGKIAYQHLFAYNETHLDLNHLSTKEM